MGWVESIYLSWKGEGGEVACDLQRTRAELNMSQDVFKVH